jgi:gas vesicle protein
MSGTTLVGLAVGVAAGLTAGLLAAPMRGTEMRANLRQRANDRSAQLRSLAESGRNWAMSARGRAMQLIDEGRRAFRTSRGDMSETGPLTATLGELADVHSSEGPHVGGAS